MKETIKLEFTHLIDIEKFEQKIDLSNHCLKMIENVEINMRNTIHLEKSSDIEVMMLNMELALYKQAYDELSTIKASTYRKLVEHVLERYSESDKRTFFKDKLGIELCDDYEFHNNRQIKAATVEVGTADNYCLTMQKTDCGSRDIYNLSNPDTELFYNEPCEVEFMKEHLEIGSVYHCMDDANFFEAVESSNDFLNEIALYLAEEAAEKQNVAFKNDLDD